MLENYTITEYALCCVLCKFSLSSVYLRPATPRTTKLSLVNVPVLSKQQISTFPANGILKGSVQNTSVQE